MKSTYLLILSFLFMNQTSAQEQFNFKKDHDALLVKDVSIAAAFYKDILGLKEIYNAGLGDKFRWFQLADKVQVHLIESSDKPLKNKGVHLAINTDDLKGFMVFLKSKGIHFENWPGKAASTNTRPDGISQIYIQDPDGYWIEVNDNKL